MQGRARSMSDSAMFQTLFGMAMFFLGLLLLSLNQRLAKSFEDFERWAFGSGPLIPDSTRGGLIVVGIIFVIVGSLYSLHFLTIS